MTERTTDFGDRLLLGCLAAPGAALLLFGIATTSAFAVLAALVWLVAIVGLLLVQRALEATVPPPASAPPPASRREDA